MNRDAEIDKFFVKDIYIASLLYSCQLKLIKIEKESNFLWFIFENKIKAGELTDRYWRKDIQVDARTFVDSIRILKDMIFAVKNKYQ